MKMFPALVFKYEKIGKTVGEIRAMYQRNGVVLRSTGG